MIKISIAIVTRNRPDSLEKTLLSLQSQSVQPFEIVISDDSNTHKHIELTQQLAQKYSCKYFSGPKAGLYSNRNFVAQRCIGTHIRTMDDDHEFPDEHLKLCMEAVNAEPQTIWTIGEYNTVHNDYSKPHQIAGQLHPRGFSYIPKEFSSYYGISCGGTIYPRAIIDKNILNVDFYKFGVAFLEYGARLKYLGYKIRPLKSTYIIHNDAKTTGSELTNEVITEARVFAMLCFSFRYQPSLKNQLLTLFELLKLFAQKKIDSRSMKNAFLHFRDINQTRTNLNI